jgi:hypothetical protein
MEMVQFLVFGFILFEMVEVEELMIIQLEKHTL